MRSFTQFTRRSDDQKQEESPCDRPGDGCDDVVAYFAILSERQLLSEDTGRARVVILDRTQPLFNVRGNDKKAAGHEGHAAKKAASSRLRVGPGKLSLSRSGGSESLRHPNPIVC